MSIDVFTKIIATGNIVQGAAHVFINTLSNTQKIDPEDLDAAYQSGVINHQSGVLDTKFDDISYYTA